jgi:hypothetical protein
MKPAARPQVVRKHYPAVAFPVSAASRDAVRKRVPVFEPVFIRHIAFHVVQHLNILSVNIVFPDRKKFMNTYPAPPPSTAMPHPIKLGAKTPPTFQFSAFILIVLHPNHNKHF